MRISKSIDKDIIEQYLITREVSTSERKEKGGGREVMMHELPLAPPCIYTSACRFDKRHLACHDLNTASWSPLLFVLRKIIVLP
jgi:hypothetical protein